MDDFVEGATKRRDFCRRLSISDSTWFKLKSQGRAPRVIRIGNTEWITRSAERDWIQEMEAHTTSEAAELEHARRTAHMSALGRLAVKSPHHVVARRRSAKAKTAL